MCVISIHVHCFEWSGVFLVFVFVFSPLNQAVHVHAVFRTSRRVHLYTQWDGRYAHTDYRESTEAQPALGQVSMLYYTYIHYSIRKT